ncbi:MAG: NUDIX domain-containing protein [Rikenellaceae bacterium]
MTIETNNSLSVDCVIFGYDNDGLKVLLVKQRKSSSYNTDHTRLKLPGSMILENETLPNAARRVLLESTGLESVYLQQTDIFSNPDRVAGEELNWITEFYNIKTNRVVTVGYYALVQITPKILKHTARKGAQWYKYDEIDNLAMDHSQILDHSLSVMRREFEHSTIAFELLPRKFTIRELQDLHSVVMGVNIDNRNFRKKILGAGILKPTGVKQRGVAHKPAEYFMLNVSAYKKGERRGIHTSISI